MVVDNVYEMISFSQGNLLEKCIIFNIQRRSQVESDFDDNFYKLTVQLMEKRWKILEKEKF